MFIKNKKDIKLDKGLSRELMLKEDKRNGYHADYESCSIFYKYIKNNISDYLIEINCHISETYSKNLSTRNICCLKNIMYQLYSKNEKNFWHELSDFIHNYASKEPVSLIEVSIFVNLYEVGEKIWVIDKKERET